MRRYLLPPNYQDNAVWAALADAIDVVFASIIDNPQLVYPILRDTFNFFPPLLDSSGNILFSVATQYTVNPVGVPFTAQNLVGASVSNGVYTATIYDVRRPTNSNQFFLTLQNVTGLFKSGDILSFSLSNPAGNYSLTAISDSSKAAQLGWSYGNNFSDTVPLNTPLTPTLSQQDMYTQLLPGASGINAIYDVTNMYGFLPEEYVKVNRQLGFYLKNAPFSNESYQILMSCLSEFYGQKGTPSFIDFYSFVLSSAFSADLLWTNDHTQQVGTLTETEYLANYASNPSAYAPVWATGYSGSGWYPTSKVQLSIAVNTYLTSYETNWDLMTRLFKYIAPINLILNSILYNLGAFNGDVNSGGAYLNNIFYGKSSLAPVYQTIP